MRKRLWSCDGGNCPYLDQVDEEFEIQGYQVGDPSVHARIRLPRATLLSMIEQLRRDLD